MEYGDLAEYARPRYVVVLEGVVCSVSPIEEARRFHRTKVTGYHMQWHDVPLKRLIVMKTRWPDYEQSIVSFVSQEVVDLAATFLDAARVPYDSIEYHDFEHFCTLLRFQSQLRAVYDSDPARLDRFGQQGVAVLQGQDF